MHRHKEAGTTPASGPCPTQRRKDEAVKRVGGWMIGDRLAYATAQAPLSGLFRAVPGAASGFAAGSRPAVAIGPRASGRSRVCTASSPASQSWRSSRSRSRRLSVSSQTIRITDGEASRFGASDPILRQPSSSVCRRNARSVVASMRRTRRLAGATLTSSWISKIQPALIFEKLLKSISTTSLEPISRVSTDCHVSA